MVDFWNGRWLFDVCLRQLCLVEDPPPRFVVEFLVDGGQNQQWLGNWLPDSLVARLFNPISNHLKKMLWYGNHLLMVYF